MANANLDQIKRIYDLIDDNFDALFAKGDPKQKARLTALRDSARDAFWKAVAENLSDDHDLVTETLQELQAANDKVEQSVKTLQNIAAVLDLVTQGVKLAAALVTLAAA